MLFHILLWIKKNSRVGDVINNTTTFFRYYLNSEKSKQSVFYIIIIFFSMFSYIIVHWYKLTLTQLLLGEFLFITRQFVLKFLTDSRSKEIKKCIVFLLFLNKNYRWRARKVCNIITYPLISYFSTVTIIFQEKKNHKKRSKMWDLISKL